MEYMACGRCVQSKLMLNRLNAISVTQCCLMSLFANLKLNWTIIELKEGVNAIYYYMR